jgi:hypothetical protein
MRAKRPILCLGPTNSDVAGIIRQTNTGNAFEYEDYDGLKKYVLEIFAKFESRTNIVDAKDLEQYTVKNQTKILAGFLNEIVKA